MSDDKTNQMKKWTGEGQPRAVEIAAEEVKIAVDEMQSAAAAEGIEKDTPLGVFVHVITWTMRKIVSLVEKFDESLGVKLAAGEALLKTTETVINAELKKLRESNEHAETVLRQADKVIAVTEIALERAVAANIKQIEQQWIKEIGPWLVLKQKRFDARAAWARWMVTAVFVVGLLGGGYEVAKWQDGPAISALGRCVAARKVMPGTNHWVCDATDLMPRAQ